MCMFQPSSTQHIQTINVDGIATWDEKHSHKAGRFWHGVVGTCPGHPSLPHRDFIREAAIDTFSCSQRKLTHLCLVPGLSVSVASQEMQLRKLQSNTSLIITTTRNKCFGTAESIGTRLFAQQQLR